MDRHEFVIITSDTLKDGTACFNRMANELAAEHHNLICHFRPEIWCINQCLEKWTRDNIITNGYLKGKSILIFTSDNIVLDTLRIAILENSFSDYGLEGMVHIDVSNGVSRSIRFDQHANFVNRPADYRRWQLSMSNRLLGMTDEFRAPSDEEREQGKAARALHYLICMNDSFPGDSLQKAVDRWDYGYGEGFDGFDWKLDLMNHLSNFTQDQFKSFVVHHIDNPSTGDLVNFWNEFFRR